MRRLTGIKTVILFLFLIAFASNAFPQEHSSTSFLSYIPKTWTKITPNPIYYEGRILRPKCSGGPVCGEWPLSCSPADTQFYFFAKGGSVNNLLIFFNGGGACWDSMNCIYLTTYSKKIDVTINALNQADGIFNTDHPANPFKDWSFVFIPYCTGDMHWGSNDMKYPDDLNWYGGGTYTIHHRGFDNFLVVLRWITRNFKGPDKIFVTGSSAGSSGAIFNFPHIREAFPTSEVSILGDSFSGVVSEDFVAASLNHWKFQSNLPAWIPGFEAPFSIETIFHLYKMIADYYSSSKVAQYTTAWDSVQTLFYNIMLNIDDPIKWVNLEAVECDWHNQTVQNVSDAAGASNYRFYLGEGSDHTILGSEKLYEEDSASVPFVEWVTSMGGTQNGVPWENAACPDCLNLCH